MKRTSTLTFTSLTLCTLTAGIANAAIMPNDDRRDFEGGADGLPFNTGVYNLNSPSAIIEDDGSAQSPFTFGPGGVPMLNTLGESKGIILTNQSANDTPLTGANFSPGFNTAQTYFLQFDYKAFDNAQNAGLLIQGNNGRAINMHMSGGANNFVAVNQGSGFVNVSETELNIGDWHRFTLTLNQLNATNDTFDLRIQSLETAAIDQSISGLGFQNNANSLSTFQFHFNTGAPTTGGQFAIDNVLWTNDRNELFFDVLTVIPEPGSMVVGMVGLGGLLFRRRRNA